MVFSTLGQDLRYARRVVLKPRAFNAGMIATIALVIGASTAMFVTLDGLLLRQFPFRDAERLVMLWESNRDTGVDHLPVNEEAYPVYRHRLSTFTEIAAFIPIAGDRRRLAETNERVTQVAATPELFDVLGAKALVGRVFSRSDLSWDTPRPALLSHEFWMTRFGARADVIGRDLVLVASGRRYMYTILGVMPREFTFPHPLFPDKPDLWTVLRYDPEPPHFYPNNFFYVIGKLKASVALARAQVDLDRVARQIALEHPREYGTQSIRALPLRSSALRNAKAVIGALVAAFLFIVLIGCANIVHLVLAGAAARKQDAAIRVALGATRMDLFRPAVFELGILFAIGGTLGLLVAYWGLKALPSLLPAQLYIPRADSLSSRGPALLFASAASLLAASTFGVVLSRGFYRASVREDLGDARGGTGTGGSMFRKGGTILLVCQVALAFALTSGALMMLHSLSKSLRRAAFVDPHTLVTLQVSFPSEVPYATTEAGFRSLLLDNKPARPVESIAVVDRYPLGEGPANTFTADGAEGPIGSTPQPADAHVVSQSYAQVFGIRLREGRWFSDSDTAEAPPVVVINEAMAQHYFPNRSPLGRVLRPRTTLIGDRRVGWQVVGVMLEDRRFASEREVPPCVYVPLAQAFRRNVTIVARTSMAGRKTVALVRDHVVRTLQGGVVIEKLQTGADILADATARLRFVGLQLGGLAGVALLLAGAGIYSVVAFRNSRRTREIAVRMAVGSSRRQVVLLVVGEALAMVAVGMAAGFPIALGLGRVLASLRYDAQALDGFSYLGAAAIFSCAALGAALPPSRRAASIEPMEVLRAQ
jgi:putative ABC transport system permease protein